MSVLLTGRNHQQVASLSLSEVGLNESASRWSIRVYEINCGKFGLVSGTQ